MFQGSSAIAQLDLTRALLQPLPSLPIETSAREVLRVLQTQDDSSLSDSQVGCFPANYVVATQGPRFVGVVTVAELVRLWIAGEQAPDMTLAHAIAPSGPPLHLSELTDMFVPLSWLRQHRTQHLPIINDNDQCVGLITPASLQTLLSSLDLFPRRSLAEVPLARGVWLPPTATLLEVAALMASRHISSVLITDRDAGPKDPNGLRCRMITEADILQAMATGADPGETPVHTLKTSRPLSVTPATPLAEVHRQMQQQGIDLAVVVDAQGQLSGTVSQASLLEVFNPLELCRWIEMLSQTLSRMESTQSNPPLASSVNQTTKSEAADQTPAAPSVDLPVDLRESRKERLYENSRAIAMPQLHTYTQLQAKLVARQEKEREVRLLYALTQAISEAENFTAALSATLYQICEISNWFCGEVWLPSGEGNQLKLGAVYCKYTDRGLNRFATLNQAEAIAPYQGFIGRVWQTHQPEWIECNSRHCPEQLLRTDTSCSASLKSACGVPILIKDEVMAVMAFFSEQAQKPDKKFLQLAESVARQLGQIIRRKQIETALQESESINRAIIAAIPDLLIRVNRRGEYLDILSGGEVKDVLRPSTHIERPTVRDVLPKALADKRAAAIEKAFVTSRSQTYEQYIELKGQSCWEEVRVVRLGEDQALVMVRDITDRKQAEEAQQQAQESLNRLNQELEHRVEQRTAALRESEERWQLALEGSDAGIWDWDFRTNAVFRSARWTEMRGLTEAEVSHSPTEWSDRIHPDDCDRVKLEFARHIARKTPYYQAEYRIQHKNGSYLWVLDRGKALWDETGCVVRMVGSESDITQRKQAELQLRKHETQLSIAQRIAGLGSWEYELATDTFEWSQETFRIFGLDPAMGPSGYQTFLQLVHPDDRPRVEQSVAALIEHQCSCEVEYRLYQPNGALRYVLSRAEPIFNADQQTTHLYGTVLDITERKLTELALQESESKLRLFVEYAPAAVAMFDQDMRYLAVSNRWREDYGLGDRPLIGHSHYDIFPDLPERWIAAHQRCLAGAVEVCEDDPFVRPDGSLEWLRWEVRPWQRFDGTIGGIVMLTEAITKRKQTEEELRQINERLTLTNAELDRATRLKDEFLANISHELRTPLNAILGMSEGLQDKIFGPLSDRQQRAIDLIERSGQHLLELINDILDLSKIESGKLELETEPVAVQYLCDSSLSFVRQQALKKNLSLTASIPPHLPDIAVDERRIRQVLINLLTNAVKFTPDGGCVELMARMEYRDGQPFLTLSVIDSGIGIAPEDVSKLFKPFVQVDSRLNRQYEGTGLGLALVRRLVELHGGKASATSTLGQGSCFSIHLPYQRLAGVPYLATEFTQDATATLPSDSPHPAGNRSEAASQQVRALIIDDSVMAAEQAARHLENMGMAVSVYTHGEGAIDAVRKLRPNLILLELLLPKRSGWEVLAQLKAHAQTRDIPVVVVSVLDERSRGLAAGAAAFLTKPLRREQLHGALLDLQVFQQEPGVRAEVPPSPSSSLPSNPDSEANPTDPQPHRILLAEDNEVNVLTLSSYLKGRGYQLSVAKTGREAVERAKAERPNLILMDIQMPEMDGLEAMQQIRTDPDLAHIPIIALTALAMVGDRERCLAAGADDYVPKPVKLKQLSERIQHLIHASLK